MRRFAFAVPGDLATPTGGYAYDRRMIAELNLLGWQVDLINLGEGFPYPGRDARPAAQKLLLAVPAGRTIVVDGLALGVLPEAAAQLAKHSAVAALVHHPLASETGLSPDQAERLRSSERAALSATRAVIVTSPATARQLAADYAVPPARITIAPPGSDPAALAQGSLDGIVRLISVGSIVPRKGFDVLVAALAMVADLPWRLTIAGDRTRDPQAAARLEDDIAHYKLGGRVETLGAVAPDRLAVLYTRADVFVLASRFEGYGMAYAEAVAHGLPVIGTTAGAIPETVPADAGILVAPDDADSLARALRRLIEDSRGRKRMAAAARKAATQLPTWQHSAELFSRALETIA